MNKVNLHDLWEVQNAAKGLNTQASSVMHQHITNGALKLHFSREVAIFGKCLVQDFEQGKKTKSQVIRELQKEKQNLWEQSREIAAKGIGLIAGVMQVVGGGATCYASAGTLCAVVGLPMMSHGANNIYENGRYFVDGNPNHVGWVRQGYQNMAEYTGYDKSTGDIAYYGADLALSAYGLFGKSTTLKPIESWNKLPHSKRFKLFRYSAEDYLRGYQATNKVALGLGGLSDAATARSLANEVQKQ
ncbi:DUF4225 domain-containing protein [Vibrio ouci]|uniref:DUF4225 domain-containing protein n=1 Tax=Vibrio ouci TaxID=2499078 RepID=A0A4Y8W967_9VIBR|nr:DUF4225 domain-containing protein [Vibrio ouci]TFH89095.1 DUF4225 domain-containing protein [Vibrio ouci]